MARRDEPTLNELVGLESQDPLDGFIPLTFASSSTAYTPLSPPPPPPFFPSLSPPPSPTGRIRMEDLEDTKGRLARRALSSPYPPRSPRASKKHPSFGPQFMNSEMFLFKYWAEDGNGSDDAGLNPAHAPATSSTNTKHSDRRTYLREDDRWVDPWNVAANQRPPGWRRASYKHRGINWQQDDPSGRMPMYWMKEYGIGEKASASESATSLVVSPLATTSDNTPRASTSTVPPTLPVASSPLPLSATPPPLAPIAADTPSPSQKEEIASTSRDATGQTSSGLDMRKAAASNARMVSMKQLRRESSSEKIAVA